MTDALKERKRNRLEQGIHLQLKYQYSYSVTPSTHLWKKTSWRLGRVCHYWSSNRGQHGIEHRPLTKCKRFFCPVQECQNPEYAFKTFEVTRKFLSNIDNKLCTNAKWIAISFINHFFYSEKQRLLEPSSQIWTMNDSTPETLRQRPTYVSSKFYNKNTYTPPPFLLSLGLWGSEWVNQFKRGLSPSLSLG